MGDLVEVVCYILGQKKKSLLKSEANVTLSHHSTLPFSQKTVRLGVALAEKVPFMLISQQ